MVAVSFVVVLFVVSAVGPVAAQSTGNETVERIAFDYGNYGGNLNIEVNGSRVFDIGSFEQSPPNGVDGDTIGGASVSVQTTSGTMGEIGQVEITGNISSFSVGGQEVWIDNVEFGPASNPSANVTFDTLTPIQPQYALADRFTESGVSMNVTPFIFSDGTSCTVQSICGFGTQDSSTPAQSGGNTPDFRPNNVNLDFNISSAKTSVNATGDTASPGGQATLKIDARRVTSVSINDIPNSWTVANSNTEGGQLIGDTSTDIVISYATAGLQQRVDISLALDVPSDASTGDNILNVRASGQSGPEATDTATVSVQDCPFEAAVCTYDPEGDIGTPELQQAISDFVQGNIDTGDLQAVISAFVQG